MHDHKWSYIFLRSDLPISQQAIQAAHSAYELGSKYGPQGHPSFVFIECKNKHELERALEKTQSQGISTHEFHEPYGDWGLTAFASEPITQDQRNIFKGYSLWRKS